MAHATTSSPSAPGLSRFRFSTDDFPEPSRIESWREIVGRTIMKVDIDPWAGAHFRAEISFRPLPGLAMSDGMGTAMLMRHTPAQADDDSLCMSISLGRGHVLRQRGRELATGEGGAFLAASAEPSQVEFPWRERFLTLSMPRMAIAPMVADFDAALIRPLQRTEALRLLVSYAEAVRAVPTLEDNDTRQLAARHLQDLIVLALGANRDAAELARTGGVRAARLSAVKAEIARNSERADLSVQEIAAHQGVTVRYVQMLFEAEGITFTEYLLAERLARAYRMLSDCRHRERSITSIAFDAGFGDLSYFDRAFHRRYGATPSDARERMAGQEE